MDLRKFPKVELHYHLDGAASAKMLIEVAKHDGVALPTYDEAALTAYIEVDENCKSLTAYLSKFELSKMCMQTEFALEHITYQAIEEVSKHNVKYIEVRYAPHIHTEGGLSLREVADSVNRGLQKGETDFGVVSRAILVCLRSDSFEKNIEVAELAVDMINTAVVGIDLAGDEVHYPPEQFEAIFKIAEENKIPITIHAGEAAGPENVRLAIELLGAKRIGHGVRAIEDKALLMLIKEKNIVLEVCPTSNVQTKAVSSWESHPVKDFIDQNVKITINTDNTAISATDITTEYENMITKYGLTMLQLKKLVINAIEAAFIDDEEMNRIKNIISLEMDEQLAKE